MSLYSFLAQEGLTAKRLFSAKNITTEIKNHIDTFVNYSRRHKHFIKECIKIALHSSYEQLKVEQNQVISFNINEVLSSDEPAIADLFFWPQTHPDNRKASDEISERIQGIQQQLSDNIQTQAQRLFESQQNIEDQATQNINDAPIQVQKDELAKFSFEILQSQNNINQSSLGYLYKIWSFLIRNNSNQALQFFCQNRKYYQLLLNNMKYYSISNLLAQILVCEDKTRKYKYQEFKRQIFSSVIEILLKNSDNDELYDGAMILVQQILNNSKQSYYEYFEDFKRQVSYITSQPVLLRFLEILQSKQQASVSNVLKYFQLIFERINSQKQENDYYNGSSSSNNNNDSLVNFEVDIFFEHYLKLVNKLNEFQQKHYSILTKIQYVTLLIEILKAPQCTNEKNNNKINYAEVLSALFMVFRENQDKGIYKVKLYKLIQITIQRCNPQQISSVISVNNDNESFYSQNLFTIKSLNFDNRFSYNKNQQIALECKIVFQLDKKFENLILQISKESNKNLKRIKDYYQTKIANFGKGSKQFSLQEQGGFFNFNQSFQNLRSNPQASQNSDRDGPFSLSLSFGQSNLVGKNNIPIPLLNLSLQQVKKTNNSVSQRNVISKLNELADTRNVKEVESEEQEIPQEIQEVIRLEPIKFGNNQIRLDKVEIPKIQLKQENKSNSIEQFKIEVQKQGLLINSEKAKYYLKHAIIFI